MPASPLAFGALLVLASELAFALMGAAIKLGADALSQETQLLFRNAVALVTLLPWVVGQGGLRIERATFRFHLLRSLAGLASMGCYFYSLAHLPLAEAALLAMTAPLFIAPIARLWLDEPMTRRTLAALALGFAGVALILRPGAGALSVPALVGLTGGALAAVAKVTIRRMAGRVPGPEIVFWFSLIGTLGGAGPAVLHWTTPDARGWGLLIGLGLCGAVGQVLMTRAYALAPAAQIGPFTYSAILYASLFGWLLWGHTLDALGLAGAALIISAGLLVLRPKR